MQTRVHLLELAKPPEALLPPIREWASKEQGRAVILTRSEFGLLPRLVEYSFLLAFKSFPLGRARSHSRDIEWLLHLAGTRSIDRALEFTRPRSRHAALATSHELPSDLLQSLGQPFAPSEGAREEGLARLADLYGFSSAALAYYSLEDLAIERTVLTEFE